MSFDYSIGTLLIWALSLWAGGAFKGVTGFGLPLVSLPLLITVFPVPIAVTMLAIPMLVSNIYLIVAQGKEHIELTRIYPLLPGIIVGIFIGVWFLSSAEGVILYWILGSMVILFSVIHLSGFRPTVSRTQERYLSPIVGSVIGLLSGIAVLGGPVLVPYMSTFGLSPKTFVGTIAFLLLVLTATLAIALVTFGVMGRQEFLYSTASLAPVLSGLWIGARIRDKVSPRIFANVVYVMLLAMGLSLIWKGWTLLR